MYIYIEAYVFEYMLMLKRLSFSTMSPFEILPKMLLCSQYVWKGFMSFFHML
jgi:hypothetical protein